MNGWARMGPTGHRWHQVEYDSRTDTVSFACARKTVRTVTDGEVMDYRWRPTWREQCLHRQCRAEVEP